MSRTFLVQRSKPVAAAPAQQYAVVSARFALALAGSKRYQSTNGKLYAVFAAELSAHAYIAEHKLRLVAAVVPW